MSTSAVTHQGPIGEQPQLKGFVQLHIIGTLGSVSVIPF
jgi:hypothetical protein